jgi:hydroxypyruvate isomerase
MSESIPRRSALAKITGGATAFAAASLLPRISSAGETSVPKLKGNINHSVCKWCYKMSLEDLCKAATAAGLHSVELLTAEAYPTLKKYDLHCAMSSGVSVGPEKIGTLQNAWNRAENHDALVEAYTKRIDEVADAGFTNVICFSGNRRGVSDEEGIANMAAGLKRIMSHAEKRKVTVCLEMLNSRVNIFMKGHPDYFCDKIEMAADVCRRVGSERMKILFDIYHVQIMQGDVITRIKEFAPLIAHYHTAGNPGRNEIDDTQELHYPGIMRAIVETGYKGHVGHEFIPTRDEVASLRQGIEACDV